MGTSKIRLTGGEPSIRSDLTDIIALTKSHGIATVAVSSNGYKLGKHLSAWHTAGLNQLNLSIDSFDPMLFKQITGFDMLPTLLGDIDTLLDSTDIRLKINGILKADTAFDNLLSALDYAKTRPVTYRFIEFMQTSDNGKLFLPSIPMSAESVIIYWSVAGWHRCEPVMQDLRPSIAMTIMSAKSALSSRMPRIFVIRAIACE